MIIDYYWLWLITIDYNWIIIYYHGIIETLIIWKSEKVWVTHWPTNNLKSRDVSASKSLNNHVCWLMWHMEKTTMTVFNDLADIIFQLYVDHNDPSKPSHRLTNGPKPSKTIESDGSNIKNHRKTIDGNGQTAQKHSMVMVSSKTIENLQWSLHFSGPPLCRPLCPWRRCFAKNSWGYLKVLSYFSQLFEISWYDIIIIWWYDLDQELHR